MPTLYASYVVPKNVKAIAGQTLKSTFLTLELSSMGNAGTILTVAMPESANAA
jgi:hypothetical protein